VQAVGGYYRGSSPKIITWGKYIDHGGLWEYHDGGILDTKKPVWWLPSVVAGLGAQGLARDGPEIAASMTALGLFC
jgi:hypothetical protein